MAGLRAAEQVRAAGWEGDLVVIGEEDHPPYNRPPLSKEALADPGDVTVDSLLEAHRLRQRSSMETTQWRLGQRVLESDLQAQRLTLSGGETLEYSGLVIATGVSPRRLHVPGPTAGRHVVRTVDDAVALREVLTPQTRVLVVGCGFIGCEVAATAIDLGCTVQLVEGTRGPMHRVLGDEVSQAMRDWLVGRGIQMHTGGQVESFLTAPEQTGTLAQAGGVRLADGTELAADVVVEAVGSVPNTSWLESNGLDLTDGVLVDDRLRVIGAARVVAVGDVARYPDPWAEQEPRRVEHWQGAIDMAKTAARALVSGIQGGDEPAPYASVPSFWSDQFGIRIQGVGAPHLSTSITVLEGSLQEIEEGVVIRYEREGRTVGVITVGLPAGRLVHLRKMLGEPLADPDQDAADTPASTDASAS